MNEQELEDVFEIQRLMDENAKLKVELEHARSYKHTIKMRNRNLQTENKRLKAELQQSATNCNKLKCLALHAMSEYFYEKAETVEFGRNRYVRYMMIAADYVHAYRKAKKALRDGK